MVTVEESIRTDEQQPVQVRAALVDWHEAFEVVTGYAFGNLDLGWERGRLFVGADVTASRPRWAYRTYDCVPAGDGCELTDLDVLVPNAIDAGMNGSVIAGLKAISAEVSAQIAALDHLGLAFWEFEESQVTSPPADDDPAWPLWRAWSIVEGVTGSGIAVTHKVLHHKRPSLFPLLDNVTHERLDGGTDAWLRIHRDLSATRYSWAALERAFAEVVIRQPRRALCLTRLRLHDILLWSEAVGAWDACREASPFRPKT